MAASIDSTAHLTPPHHRSRKPPPPSPSTLDSLRSTLSQASLYETHSTRAAPSSTTSLPGLLAQSQRQRATRDQSSSSPPSSLSPSSRESNRSQKSHQAPTPPVKMRSQEGIEMSGSRPPHPASTGHSSTRNKSSLHSTAPRRTSSNFYSQQNNSSNNLLHQDSTTGKDNYSTKPTLPALQISTDKSWSIGWAQGAVENVRKGGDAREQKDQQNDSEDDGEDNYFGDILDKYCNSDDDPTSPSTASPTSPFSERKDFWAAQPPTPPVTNSNRRLDRHQQQQRDPFAVQSPSRRAVAPLRNAPTPAQPTDFAASTTSLSSTTPSTTNSPMMAASAKFSSYLQSGATRGSRESFTLHDTSSSTTVGTNSTPRSYSKRPLPVPSSSTTALSSASNSISTSASPRVSVASTSNRSSFLSLNHSTPDLRDVRPEPPQKDSTRRTLGNAQNNNNINNNSPYPGNNNNYSISASHLPPMLGDTHLSDSLTSFSAVVEASMERRRNPSVSSGGSSTLADINPYADNAITGAVASLPTPSSNSSSNHHGSSTGSTGHGHGTSGSSSNKSSSRSSHLNYLTNGRSKDRTSGSNHQHLYHHQTQNSSATSLSRGQQHQSQSEEQAHYRQRHQHQQQSSSSSSRPYDGSSHSRYSSSSPALYSPSPSGGGATPSEMFSNRLDSSRLRSHSQGSISTTSSTTNSSYSNSNSHSYQYQHQPQQNPHQRQYGAVRPAIMKTPIARARAREAKGPRKVVFGDMITIVTIEQPEAPPPPVSTPGSDKDKKKKAAAAAKKKAKKNGDKTGPHPDPEYDEEYYNQPYTPLPADVLVTQAPWIGNPNYDEEKQNSKFYYEDDTAEYEYDDYEYEAPFDIRSGPGDEDDDEEDEEDEDDDDSVKGRAWGNGIAGGGAAGAKKKGGMFKFKKAVNRLLRN